MIYLINILQKLFSIGARIGKDGCNTRNMKIYSCFLSLIQHIDSELELALF